MLGISAQILGEGTAIRPAARRDPGAVRERDYDSDIDRRRRGPTLLMFTLQENDSLGRSDHPKGGADRRVAVRPEQVGVDDAIDSARGQPRTKPSEREGSQG